MCKFVRVHNIFVFRKADKKNNRSHKSDIFEVRIRIIASPPVN